MVAQANVKTETWKCGHPRTAENSVGHQLRYGCRICVSAQKRARYYRSRGYETPPLPLAYRNALRGFVRNWTNVGGTYIHERIRRHLANADPLTRACYLMIIYHQRPVAEVAHWLQIDEEDALARKDEIAQALSLTEHQDMYKDWSLVQELIDAGVSEREAKEMIDISQAGWDAAKRRGDVRV
jgi:hypothetical protein